jgi:type VI secretion system VgrG family protein
VSRDHADAQQVGPGADAPIALALDGPAIAPGDLTVLELQGGGAIAQPYRFRLRMAAQPGAVDLDRVLAAPAKLTIARTGERTHVHGVFAELARSSTAAGDEAFVGVLVPKLWLLALSRRSRVFQDLTVREIAAQVLRDATEFEDRCRTEYPKLEFSMQYEESDLDFLSRLLEHHGIFYWFEHSAERSTVILGDDVQACPRFRPGDPVVPVVAPGGLRPPCDGLGGAISALCERRQAVTAALSLADYNYRNPALRLSATASVHTQGRGQVATFGGNSRDEREVARLCQVRAQELACQQLQWDGRSDCASFAPGRWFGLGQGGARVLLTEVEHFAACASSQGPGGPATYHNQFVAVPADAGFRPPRRTEKPRIHGVLSARVDGAGGGPYAEIDGHGRYKVRLPFALNGEPPGCASHWIRMAQPSAGAGYGVHFPLHTDTEVLLSFLGGDVDRPIIHAAVPNAVTPGPVAAENAQESRIETCGGNRVVLSDEQRKECIQLLTPNAATLLQLGDPTGGGDALVVATGGGLHASAAGDAVHRTGGTELRSAGAMLAFAEQPILTSSLHGIRQYAGQAPAMLQFWKARSAEFAEQLLRVHPVAAGAPRELAKRGSVAGLAALAAAELYAEGLERAAKQALKAALVAAGLHPRAMILESAKELVLAAVKTIADGEIELLSTAGNLDLFALTGRAHLAARAGIEIGTMGALDLAAKEVECAAQRDVRMRSRGGAMELRGHFKTHLGFCEAQSADDETSLTTAIRALERLDAQASTIALAAPARSGEGGALAATADRTATISVGHFRVCIAADRGIRIERDGDGAPRIQLEDNRITLSCGGFDIRIDKDRIVLGKGQSQRLAIDDQKVALSWQGSRVEVTSAGVKINGLRVAT